MLESLFSSVLRMSLTASYAILFVLLARLFLKKAPKIFSYALWSVVLFRLVCPFSFESAWSFLPGNDPPVLQEVFDAPTVQRSGAAAPAATPTVPAAPTGQAILPDWNTVAAVVWLAGIAVLLVASTASLIKLRRHLRSAVPYRDNIYLSGQLETAFVIGFIRPKIYLPANLSDAEQSFILLHEQTHIKRLDYLVKVVSFFALCLHWFNPLVWLAFALSGKDMEMSCDEAVIKRLGSEVKKDYSSSLLTLAAGKRLPGGTPLAFGEGDTKGRIRNVLHYKKPAFWVIAIAVAAVVCVGAGLLANPVKNAAEASGPQPLLQYRTSHLGNNTAVGNLVSALDFPENLQYDGIELQTAEPPYGITIRFKTDTETRNFYSGALNQNPFQQNAVLLFSLIENADTITFTWDDGENPYSESFSREWAETLMGEENLFGRTETPEKLEALLQELPAKVDSHTEEQIKHPEETPNEAITFYVKPDEPLDVIGNTAATVFLNIFAGESVPAESRIANFQITDIALIAGEPKAGTSREEMPYHYVVQMTYDIETASEEYLAAGDGVSGKGKFSGLFRELCVKALENGSFAIVSAGTGGGTQAFAPPSYQNSLTDDERKETEAIASSHFTDVLSEKVASLRAVPDDSPQYQNQGIESEYAAGNLIIYEVLTEKDQREGLPPRTISIARKDRNAEWEVLNWGY